MEPRGKASRNYLIKFVGQPIFNQFINLIDEVNLSSLEKKYSADYYYKAFKAKTPLITVLFSIFSRCESMTEICEGLRAMSGKQNLLGLEKAPDKSTACAGMRNPNNKFVLKKCDIHEQLNGQGFNIGYTSV
jgi:hypothetical protein